MLRNNGGKGSVVGTSWQEKEEATGVGADFDNIQGSMPGRSSQEANFLYDMGLDEEVGEVFTVIAGVKGGLPNTPHILMESVWQQLGLHYGRFMESFMRLRKYMASTGVGHNKWAMPQSGVPKEGRKDLGGRKKTFWCIPAWIYCHNIPETTLLGVYHKLTQTTKNADMTKKAEKLHKLHECSTHYAQTSSMESGRENAFRLEIQKNQKIGRFRPKWMGSFFFKILEPCPPPPPREKKGFSHGGWGEGQGSKGVPTKNSVGDVFIKQNNDFTKRANQHFNPLG